MQWFISASRTTQNVISNNLSSKLFRFRNVCRCGTTPKAITAFQPISTAWTTSFFELTCQKMRLPDMVSVPLHEQVISPLWGGISWFFEIDDSTLLDVYQAIFYSQLCNSFKNRTEKMNKSHISFVFVKGSQELDKEGPQLLCKTLPSSRKWVLLLDLLPLIMVLK